MRSTAIVMTFAASVLAAAPALGLTIKNAETVEQRVTITTSSGPAEHVIAAGVTFEQRCPEACRIKVKGIEGELLPQPEDKLTIKGGKITIEEE